ncbi:MAG: DUF6125 family protein [Raoultibacter sp.]|jgi:hypothetical protein
MNGKSTGIDGMESIKELSREELIDMVGILAKNLHALDGTWFQSIEREQGMDDAIHHDLKAWERFTISEARRIKKFLKLEEQPGLDGLEKALILKSTTLSNVYEMFREDNTLTFRMVDCRVQNARERKGMGFHPCKPVGEAEYAGFAATIDSRISCECLSCFPDMNDKTCNCSWKFTLDESAS